MDAVVTIKLSPQEFDLIRDAIIVYFEEQKEIYNDAGRSTEEMKEKKIVAATMNDIANIAPKLGIHKQLR